MIEKRTSIETLEISGDRVIIREKVWYEEDGKPTPHHYEHREIGPDDDASGESERVRKAVEAARTQDSAAKKRRK